MKRKQGKKKGRKQYWFSNQKEAGKREYANFYWALNEIDYKNETERKGIFKIN